jgi:hypothetical protein
MHPVIPTHGQRVERRDALAMLSSEARGMGSSHNRSANRNNSFIKRIVSIWGLKRMFMNEHTPDWGNPGQHSHKNCPNTEM